MTKSGDYCASIFGEGDEKFPVFVGLGTKVFQIPARVARKWLAGEILQKFTELVALRDLEQDRLSAFSPQSQGVARTGGQKPNHE